MFYLGSFRDIEYWVTEINAAIALLPARGNVKKCILTSAAFTIKTLSLSCMNESASRLIPHIAG